MQDWNDYCIFVSLNIIYKQIYKLLEFNYISDKILDAEKEL